MSSSSKKNKPSEKENDQFPKDNQTWENYLDFIITKKIDSLLESKVKEVQNNSSRKRLRTSSRSSSIESSGSSESCSESSSRNSRPSSSLNSSTPNLHNSGRRSKSRRFSHRRRHRRRARMNTDNNTEVKTEDIKPDVKIEVKTEPNDSLKTSSEKKKIETAPAQESSSNKHITDVTITSRIDKNAKIREVIVIDSNSDDDIIWTGPKITPQMKMKQSNNIITRKSYRCHVIRQRIKKTMMNNRDNKKGGKKNECSNKSSDSTSSSSETSAAENVPDKENKRPVEKNDNQNNLNAVAVDTLIRENSKDPSTQTEKLIISVLDNSARALKIDAGNPLVETKKETSRVPKLNCGKTSMIQAVFTETKNIADKILSAARNKLQLQQEGNISVTSVPKIDAENPPVETKKDTSRVLRLNCSKTSTIQAVSTEIKTKPSVVDKAVPVKVNQLQLQQDGNNSDKGIPKSVSDKNTSKSNPQTTSGKVLQPKKSEGIDVLKAKNKEKKRKENTTPTSTNSVNEKTNPKETVVSSNVLRNPMEKSIVSNSESRNVESHSNRNTGKKQECLGCSSSNKNVARKDPLGKPMKKNATSLKTEESGQCSVAKDFHDPSTSQRGVKKEEEDTDDDSKEGILQTQQKLKRFPCRDSDCDKTFASKVSANIHYSCLHIGHEVKCKACKTFYASLYRLSQHKCEPQQ